MFKLSEDIKSLKSIARRIAETGIVELPDNILRPESTISRSPKQAAQIGIDFRMRDNQNSRAKALETARVAAMSTIVEDLENYLEISKSVPVSLRADAIEAIILQVAGHPVWADFSDALPIERL